MTDNLNQIYEKLGSIQSDITHIKGDTSEIKEHARETRERVERHEARWNRVIGYCIAVAGTVGGAVAYVPKAVAELFR